LLVAEVIAALATLDNNASALGLVEAFDADQDDVIGVSSHGAMIGRDISVVSGVVRRTGESECRRHAILCWDWPSILPVG